MIKLRVFLAKNLIFLTRGKHRWSVDLQGFVRGKQVKKNDGGWGEIRTHGMLSHSAVFKTAALNHSATHPFNFRKSCGKILSLFEKNLNPQKLRRRKLF